MKLLKFAVTLSMLLVQAAVAVAQSSQPASEIGSAAPGTSARTWSPEPRWRGPGPMPRHYMVMLWGIPAPYGDLTNPANRRATTLERGGAIYARECASCHGEHGAGDGDAGRGLSPPPGNLVWLSDVPRRQWDAFMYWATAEGGIALGTAMPAFKDKLSQDDIWAVTAYIQANLPFDSYWR